MIRLAMVSVVGAVVATGPAQVASAATGDCDAAAGGLFPNGDGSMNDPYLVTTSTQLAAIDTFAACHDENFVQGGNITLTGPWTPIGSGGVGFIGTYRGGGHTISGLELAGVEAGLFFVGNTGASFYDLNIVVASSAAARDRVGALVGMSLGPLTIDDVHVTGDVSGSGSDVGGLVGQSRALTVVNSSVDGDVTADKDGLRLSYAGGVVGYALGAVSITAFDLTGDVSGSGSSVGGLVGQSGALTVSGSSVTGNVTGSDDGSFSLVGGVLGGTSGSAVSITSTEVRGHVTGSQKLVGGLVGASGQLTVSDSLVVGNVTTGDDGAGSSYVGGVVGFASGSLVSITSTDVVGNVSGTGSVAGGLVGQSGVLVVSDSLVVGNVTTGDDGAGSSYVGGVVGLAPSRAVTISATRVVGGVSGSGDSVGGLVGQSGELTVSDSSVTGNVSSSAGGLVGGVVGNAPVDPVSVVSTDVVGDVSGSGSTVGGLVGQSGVLTVSGSSVEGDVSSSAGGFVGGVVGFAPGFSVSIRSTEISGHVSATGDGVGGLVGFSGALTVSGSSVAGDVSSSAGVYVGGLVGFSGALTVSGSSVAGNVSAGVDGQGSSYAGGVVGFGVGAVTLSAVAMTGGVSGSGTSVGGLVGQAGQAGSAVDVTNSLYRGTVNGLDKVGGLVGSALDDVVLENVYVAGSRPDPAVTDQGGFLGSAGGTLTVTASFCTGSDCGVGNRVDDADLKTRSTFTGWDFDTVWCLSSSVNNGYPVLRAITNPVVGFAACWAPVVAVTPIWRVGLDPNGGACADGDRRHDDEWTSVFVGYRYLPGAVECERDGFEFSGWADVELPDEVVDLPILADPTDGAKRAFLAANADLIAVWKEVEVELDDLTGTAPGAFVGGPDRRTREGGGVVEGYYIPPNTLFGLWMLASA